MTTMMIYDDGGDGDDTMTKTTALTALQGSLEQDENDSCMDRNTHDELDPGEFWCRRWAELVMMMMMMMPALSSSSSAFMAMVVAGCGCCCCCWWRC